ncbi:uncharacterized protein EDB91DRAFT_1113921 [Suillus paluster]|uniref:uncharacterized protein n=1 Tax=Suillus paluster TaxID=48578 RepID=UPI001B8607E2|nr:uncharacterized protein EDB91DRAFT_1113921 [Suillus paluster]KAG1748428.1 hypothetical protein EDB91DRAFT_1113921 [Suillus paluster]
MQYCRSVMFVTVSVSCADLLWFAASKTFDIVSWTKYVIDYCIVRFHFSSLNRAERCEHRLPNRTRPVTEPMKNNYYAIHGSFPACFQNIKSQPSDCRLPYHALPQS